MSVVYCRVIMYDVGAHVVVIKPILLHVMNVVSVV